MTMAAAASNGDVQDRIEKSNAQDSADGNDSCYFSESLIFPVFCGCSRVQNLQAQKGETMDGVQGFCCRMEPVELSGRTTGRPSRIHLADYNLRHRRATLALRYSIISASTAARPRQQ